MNFATKLLVGSLGVLLVSSTVNMLYSYRVSKEALREEFANESEATAVKIAKILQPHLASATEVCELAKKIVEINSLQYLTVSQSDKVLCDLGSKHVGLNLSAPEESRRSVEQSRVYTTYAAVSCAEAGCAPVELEVGISFTRLDKALALLWRTQLSNTITLMSGAALFLFVFALVIRRRLEKLSAACVKIQNGDLDLRLATSGSDEISRVAAALNNMARDLRLAAEERERQKVILVQASKMSALGEMAGGMAHEINNPLAIIKMTASQLEEVLVEDPVDKALTLPMLATIVKTAERISKIILGLRAFSREGSSDPFVKVNVLTLIEETTVLCRDRFKQHGIDLIVEEFAPALEFEGRSTQISQVLLNLLNNAHDAVMAAPGAKWVKISAALVGGLVEIRVTDSNLGIPLEVQKKMFQPFFTTKEVGKGTGMGLSISVGIMKSHHGELSVDNTCANTRFVISIPRVQPAVAA